MSAVLIPLADNVEDIETVTIIDILRRARLEVTSASIYDHKQITAARGTKIEADQLLVDCLVNNWDLIVLPGGMPGAENLSHHPPLIDMLRKQSQAGKLYAAICASPAVVFAPHGLLDGKQATSYPTMQDKLPDTTRASESTVIDGHCITSQGPATAMEFSLTLVELLQGSECKNQLAQALLYVKACE